jgi:HNH endonuclease/AP2 domain
MEKSQRVAALESARFGTGKEMTESARDEALRLWCLANLSYCADTGELRWKRSKKGIAAGSIAGCLTKRGYVRLGIGQTMYQAHRICWLMARGPIGDLFIDHINGNRSDNRLSNLRLCTNGQNIANAKRFSTNKCGLKGVSKKRNRYRAEIRNQGRLFHLGTFDTAEQAHAAYCQAASKLHGEFARHG